MVSPVLNYIETNSLVFNSNALAIILMESIFTKFIIDILYTLAYRFSTHPRSFIIHLIFYSLFDSLILLILLMLFYFYSWFYKQFLLHFLFNLFSTILVCLPLKILDLTPM